MRALALLLLSGCSEWPATPKAGFERMAAARLSNCVVYNHCTYVEQCFRESEAYCVDAGYAKTCGNGEVEGSCGSGVK